MFAGAVFPSESKHSYLTRSGTHCTVCMKLTKIIGLRC